MTPLPETTKSLYADTAFFNLSKQDFCWSAHCSTNPFIAGNEESYGRPKYWLVRGYHFKIMYLENNMCYYASLRKIICEVFFKLSLFFFFSSICCLWRQKCIIPATKLRLRQSRKIYGIPLRQLYSFITVPIFQCTAVYFCWQCSFSFTYPSIGILWRFIIVPKAKPCNIFNFIKMDCEQMIFSKREGNEPHMVILSCDISPIY